MLQKVSLDSKDTPARHFSILLISFALCCPTVLCCQIILSSLVFVLFICSTSWLTQGCLRCIIVPMYQNTSSEEVPYMESWEPQNGLQNPDNDLIRNSFFVVCTCASPPSKDSCWKEDSCNCAGHS